MRKNYETFFDKFAHNAIKSALCGTATPFLVIKLSIRTQEKAPASHKRQLHNSLCKTSASVQLQLASSMSEKGCLD